MTHAAADPPPFGDEESHPVLTRDQYAILRRAARDAETPELRYMRETRNAVTFIAVIVGIVAALALIATIIVGVQLGKLNSDLNGISGGGTSNCLSQGGTDPSC